MTTRMARVAGTVGGTSATRPQESGCSNAVAYPLLSSIRADVGRTGMLRNAAFAE